MSFGGGSFGGGNSTGNSTGGGSSFGGGSSGGPSSSSCNNPRGQILEAFFLVINPLNCWLILSRFYMGRGIYFGREKKWSTILQIFMLCLYVLRNKSPLLKLLLNKDIAPIPTAGSVFGFFSGYAQYLMIIYKSTQIILTYFRNKMRTEKVLIIVDGIFAFVTVALVVTYAIPAQMWFSHAGFSNTRKGLDYFNWQQLALALVAFISSTVLVYLILRAEKDNPFKNIILNRNMFLIFIALQLAAMLFMNGLNIGTVLGSNLLGQATVMRTTGFLMIDICILFFEWNHGKLFTSGDKKTTTSANSKRPLQSGTGTQNQRNTMAATRSVMADDTASKV